MARISAKNTAISIVDSSGVLRDIAFVTNSVKITINSESPEVTSFVAGMRERLPDGIKDWSIAFNGFYTESASAINEILSGILSASTRIQVQASSGSIVKMYVGNGILNDYKITNTVIDAVSISGKVIASEGCLSHGAIGLWDELIWDEFLWS